MANIDVVARLQLNAAQFSSETGKQFADMKTRAASAAQEVRSAFGTSFAEVQKLASQSLTLPRTTGGSLDLSSEIASLQGSAAAAEQRAQALRELSIAQTAAAGSAKVDAEAMRLEADASAIGALAAERDAEAIRDRIAALGIVQSELNKTTSSTRQLTDVEQKHLVSSGQARASAIQLGQQFQDFSVQVLSGQSAFVAFAQQAPQAGYALSGFQGKLGAIGTFLTGPWGVALTIGISALGILGGKLLETADNAKAAELATSSLGDAESTLADIFGKTSGRIAEQNELLVINARIKAINLRADAAKDAADSKKAFTSAGTTVASQAAGSGLTNALLSANNLISGQRDLGNPAVVALAARARAANGLTDPAKQQAAFEAVLASAEKTDFSKSDIDKTGFIEAVSKAVASRANTVIAGLLDKSLNTGKIDAALQRSTGGTGSRTTALDEQAKLNSATSARERAEAQLALTRTKSKAALDAGTISEAEYTRRVTDGEQAVNRAQAAEKAATAAKRDATRARSDANKEQRAAISLANEQQSADQKIANISGRFDAAPKLKDQQAAAQRELQAEIDKYDQLTDAVSRSIVEKARAAQLVVAGAPERIFGDYVRQQRESLAVQQLVLQGRDEEANALQQALRFQAQGIDLDEAHLTQLLGIERRQKAITDAIEDQRRVVGLYLGTVSDLQRTFDEFLSTVQQKPGKAIGGLFTGIVDDFRQLNRNLLSDSIFGGLQRKVEEAMRQAIGGAAKTPAEGLRDQAGEVGTELKTRAGDVDDALDDLIAAFRSASSAFSPATNDNFGAASAQAITAPAEKIALDDIIDLSGHASALALRLPDPTEQDASATGDIVVTARRLADGGDHVRAAATFLGTVVDGLSDNLHKLGIDVPRFVTDGIKSKLPDVIKGVGYGQLGGSVFASITGGKQSSLGSSVGGVLGEVAGKALGKSIGSAAGGLLKSIGGAAGPLGAIAGGIIGSVIGGLFKKTPKSSAGVTTDQYGQLAASSATGTTAKAKQEASQLAGSVATGLQQIANQLGAKISGSSGVQIGTYKDEYRVTDSSKMHDGIKGNAVSSFSDTQAAVSKAVSIALSDGVLSGISKASLKILASGQDISAALAKAMAIEAIPKDLKALLDPVGAAIDTLNTKWATTVAALKEGGATAEQMAQAQQLYNLQLAQVKNSTDAADATLKGFLADLKLGSDSPYSLRDQEATAKAQLQPFLDQIDAGQAIDQAKYQDAAKAFLDVERQLNGSTQGYFNALDQIQSATNKAIATIDNAVPITAAVDSPFASQTAASAAATAGNTSIANDLLSQLSDQFSGMQDMLGRIAENTASNGGGSFIGSSRKFVAAV